MLTLLRRSSFCVWILLGTLVLAWGSVASAAGLAGQSLSGAYYLPDTSTVYVDAVFAPSSFVVGAGLESTVDVEGVTDLLIDFEDYSLTITLNTVLGTPTWLSNPFNGLIFESVGALGVTGASVDGSTTMAGFDDSRVSFNATQLFVNWNGLSYVDGTQVKINLTVPVVVPEPGTAMLLGLGLVGIAARRRSR